MTDWNKIEDTFETIDNELSSVLCDAYDLKNFLKVQKMAHVSKDNDGSIIPIIDCAESIIKFLESIERNNKWYGTIKKTLWAISQNSWR